MAFHFKAMDVEVTIPNVIDRNAPELLQKITLTEELLWTLVKKKVILHHTMQDLQVYVLLMYFISTNYFSNLKSEVPHFAGNISDILT